MTATYTQKDMVLGWHSQLISTLISSPDHVLYTDDLYRSGDAIFYASSVTPFIQGNMWSRSSTNPVITVNSGYPNPSLAGKIKTMNGYDYPNVNFKVYDGLGGS